ncbi:MAG: ABC transporter substrate-binding protein [Rhodobacteraceae bacterium]|nr:ABC transporter substrate-binding protein [Paracoccaceae bacterium]
MTQNKRNGLQIAALKNDIQTSTLNWLGLGATIAILMLATIASAQEITKSYGISKFGELKYAEDFEYLDYVNPDAPKGGEYSTWAFGSFDSFHPYIAKGRAAIGASIQFESLMVGTADEADSMYGLLAESLEYPSDYSWAIFRLRPEAKFSDGSPVTAEDVVFSQNILQEKGIPSIQTFFAEAYESVEALDPLTVKFTFREPSETNDMVMQAASTTVFSKAWWEGRDFAESTLDVPMGSSEYILESMDIGKTVVYRLRDDYWGKDLPINIGRSNFATLRFEYYADPTAAFEGFKAGETTFRVENSSLKWAQDYNFPALEKGWVQKTELPDGNIAQAQGFFYNIRKAPFDDIRVRQALGMMFNFEWSNETLLFGLYERVNSFWGNSDLEAQGTIPADELAILEPFRDLLPESVFTQTTYIPPKSGTQQLDRSQVRAAGKLLDDAGWLVGDDGMRRNAEGVALAIDILNNSPAFDRIINPYVENLKTLGVEATHTRVDSAQYTERRRSFDFDMLVSTYGNSITPGLGLKQWYGSENADVPSRNIAGLKNEAIDALVEIVISSETREELNLNTRALDRALRALHIRVPQWYKNVHTVAYLDVYKHPENLPPYSLGDTDFWWYDADRAAELKAAGAF